MYKNSAVRPPALYKYSYHTWHRKHILKEANPHTIIERQLTPNLMHLSTCYNESTLDTHTHTHLLYPEICLCLQQKQLGWGFPFEVRHAPLKFEIVWIDTGRRGAWQLGSPWSRNINQALISWITATRKNVNRQPGDGSSWVFRLLIGTCNGGLRKMARKIWLFCCLVKLNFSPTVRLLILHLNWHVPRWQTAGKPSTLFDLVGLDVARC